jgi:rhodanese-related sulfurtransferase
MIKSISASQLQEAIDRGERFQLIDVRSAEEYASGHVPCAVNLPMEQVEARLDDLHQHDPLVLICQSGNRAEITGGLLAPHRNDLVLLEGGTTAWESAGRPVVATRSTRLPLMRQVQLVVGPLALIGSILALTLDSTWALLPAFIGAGLTMAGATGFCGMGALLGKMPWNRPTLTNRAQVNSAN